MSIDFIALFDRGEQPEAESLLSILERGCAPLDEMVARYRSRWRPQTWTLGVSPATEQEEIVGPGGFVFGLAVASLEVSHCMRFSTFTHDESVQLLMRRTCLFIADTIGSERAIYTHELMPYGDGGLADSEQRLRTRIGPPAATLGDLRGWSEFGRDSWFVEDFRDLRASFGPGRY